MCCDRALAARDTKKAGTAASGGMNPLMRRAGLMPIILAGHALARASYTPGEDCTSWSAFTIRVSSCRASA
jgi:hypothetical protein